MTTDPILSNPGERRYFSVKLRLRRPAEFKRVYSARRRSSDQYIIIYVAPNQLDHPRLGLSVSRRVGNSVRRNRWKRLLREAFRLEQCRLPTGYDLVIVPHPGIEPELAPLRKSLIQLAKRATAPRNPS